ncbi:MAG: DNA repair protein RecO, partial [Myxococcaceae bacterium]
MDRWEDEALVLGTLDYGEADRLVTLLTRERGKLTAFAAGARKSRRRFAGALEPGTVLRARLVERHGSTVRLDAVEVVNAFPRIRDELPRIARALYALELCRELLREQEPAPQLLSLAVDWLGRLDA